MERVCRLIILMSVSLAVLAGCSTIFDAREAQEELEPIGQEDSAAPQAEKLDLRGYSLEQLVDFAMTNRPSIAAATLAVKDARLAMKELRADAPLVSDTPWTSPRLNLSAAYSESSRGTRLSDAEFGTQNGNPSAGLSLDLLVWDFGRYDARAQAQAENVISAEYRLITEGYGVFYDVASAYFTLLEKGALWEVAKTNEHMYAIHLEQAEKKEEAGEAKKLDVLRARLDLAQAKEKTVNSRMDVRIAGAELMRALGISASHGTREETMDFEENALSFVLRGLPDTDYTVEQAFQLARTNSPSLRIARAKLRAASANVDYAIASLYPEISVNASLSWTDPLWYFGWGISAAQSIFQGFRKTTAVERAVVSMQSAAADVMDADHQLSLDLEVSLAARDNAKESRRTARESLRRAEENYELIERQYEIGDVSRVEYADSVSGYVEAMGNLIKAFYLGQRAESSIYSLLGVAPSYEEKKIVRELNHE